jgi:hypothetical protein
MSIYSIDECSLSTIYVEGYSPHINLLNKLEEVEKTQSLLISKFEVIVSSLNKFFRRKKKLSNTNTNHTRVRIRKSVKNFYVKKLYLNDE